jgi:2-octaprenyl-6-methoxyphenol hydroxylase
MAKSPAHRAKLDYHVLISGGSFAGILLARALNAAFGGDVRVAIIERFPLDASAKPDARAFAITAAAKRMLDALGFWPTMAHEAQKVARIEISDSGLEAGIRPLLLSYDNILGDGEPASYILPAATLQRVLESWLKNEPSITVIAPASIMGFEADRHAVVSRTSTGDHIKSLLLVAADGKRSPLREMAGIKSVGWPYGQIGIVTLIEHTRPHGETAIQHFLPGGPFAILPLPGDRSCITWSEDEIEAQRILALSDADFLSEVEKRAGGRVGEVKLVGERQAWPLELHLARSYVAPRFALIGDAAHVVHPLAGQGLNLALRDAAALAEVLAEAARIGLDFGNWDSLCRYERWRRFDSATAAFAFDGLNRTFSNDGTIRRAVRDFGLGVVNRLPSVKGLLVKEAAGISGELPRLLRGEAI